MNIARQIIFLTRWEARREWTSKAGLAGLLLYVVSTVVIVYFATRETLQPATVNALYWVVVFFGATVTCGRSFLREGGRRHLYYYTLVAPESLLVSKFVYNLVVLYAVNLLVWGLMTVLTGTNFVTDAPYFLLALLVGSLGLSGILTFISALAARAGGNGTLMAVLSFPLLIPLLYLLVIAGQHASGDALGKASTPLLLMGAIDLLTLAVGLLLFPFVWRD